VKEEKTTASKESDGEEDEDENEEEEKEHDDNEPQENQKDFKLKEEAGPSKSAKTQSKSSVAAPLPLKKLSKTKQKKLNKYKDQDDEDREIFMQYLAPAGENSKKAAKNLEKQKLEEKKSLNKQKQLELAQRKFTKKSNALIKGNQGEFTDLSQMPSSVTNADNEPVNDQATTTTVIADADGAEDDMLQNLEEESKVIDSLTGQPLDEDEILFCIAVCAPYSCLQNYKHKVKLNPGTSKKGQAVKTSLEMFNRDKETTPRERNLIRSNLAKTEDVSRNFPGRVKVSAPNLIRRRKK
jgi:hypothetical protein